MNSDKAHRVTSNERTGGRATTWKKRDTNDKAWEGRIKLIRQRIKLFKKRVEGFRYEGIYTIRNERKWQIRKNQTQRMRKKSKGKRTWKEFTKSEKLEEDEKKMRR